MKISNTFKESISKTGIYTTRFRWTKNVCFKMFTSWKFLTILEGNFKSCGQFTINFAGQNIFVSKRARVEKFRNSEKQFLQVVCVWQSAAANRCVYKIVAGRWSIGLLIIILLLWLVETDVFQMPQLHKHFNVVRYYWQKLLHCWWKDYSCLFLLQLEF
jgi:hypothetical protein